MTLARDTLTPFLDELHEEELADLLRALDEASTCASGDSAAGDSAARTPYRLRRLHALGGMGAILEVEDLRLGRRVAMKIQREREGCSALAARRRFEREVRIGARLQHPGVVPVHDFGTLESGRAYFTMPLLDGRSLRTVFDLARARREGFHLGRAVGLLVRVCETVAYAHEQGVVHRDLKPDNVLVGAFGETYVLDWGLAKLLARRGRRAREVDPAPQLEVDAEETLPGAILGTPAYMAPEQAEGRGDEVDEQSDVYSLGAMLYTLLDGHAPHGALGGDRAALLEAVRAGPPPRPRSEHAPEELVAVCERAMERDRGRRYPSVRALQAELEAWLDGRAVLACPQRLRSVLARWARQHRAAAATCALAAVGSAAALALAAGVQARANERLREAVSAREREQARAEASLAELRHLSDDARVSELVDPARSPWPATSEQVPAMERWLRDAERMLARWDVHAGALLSLCEGVEAAGSDVPLASALAALRGGDRGDGLREDLAELRRPERPPLFEDDVLRWRYTVLLRHLANLLQLEELRGEMLERVASARDSWRVSMVEAEDAWREAREAVRAAAVYDGLELAPQVGLVPLGADPFSGLQEFWHVQSGERPRRDPATERLVVGEETGVVLVLLPGGSFDMGSRPPDPMYPIGSPNVDAHHLQPEGPVRRASVEPFFLAKHELTQGQWQRVMGANPSQYPPGMPGVGLENPVENVTWHAAREALRRLDLRLPREVEWEYACRAGTTTVYSCGDTASSLRGFANIAMAGLSQVHEPEEVFTFDDGYELHAPVGSFEPNPFGLHDLHGNVAEMCDDFLAPWSDPLGPLGEDEFRQGLLPLAELKIVRGGAYCTDARWARSAFRGQCQAASPSDAIGLRPARSLRGRTGD